VVAGILRFDPATARREKRMQDFEVGQQAAPTQRGLLQRLVDDVRLLVMVGCMNDPSDAEFDAHVVEALAMAPSVRAVLVVLVSDAAGLSPERRVKLARAGLLEVPTAVMTGSIRIRGMLTPINWLGGQVKPFGMLQFDEACDYLAVPYGARARLRDQMLAMRTELAGEPGKGEDRASRSGTFAAVRRAVAAGFAMVRKRGGEGGRRW
jgi:hypothetical protein